jgi:hypothetical protein
MTLMTPEEYERLIVPRTLATAAGEVETYSPGELWAMRLVLVRSAAAAAA